MITRLSAQKFGAFGLLVVAWFPPNTVYADSFCRAVARSDLGGMVTVTTGAFDGVLGNIQQNLTSPEGIKLLNLVRQPQVIWSLPSSAQNVEVDLGYLGPRNSAFDRASGGHVTVNMSDRDCKNLDLRIEISNDQKWIPLLGQKKCGMDSTRSDFIFNDPAGLREIIAGHDVRVVVHPFVGADREVIITASGTSARDALLSEDWAQIDRRNPAVCRPVSEGDGAPVTQRANAR